MKLALLFVLCLPLAAEDQPGLQRQAWLSEKENDQAQRWFKQNKKLFNYLFTNWNIGRVKTSDLTREEIDRINAWRKENDTLFAKLYGRAWPEAIEGRKGA